MLEALRTLFCISFQPSQVLRFGIILFLPLVSHLATTGCVRRNPAAKASDCIAGRALYIIKQFVITNPFTRHAALEVRTPLNIDIVISEVLQHPLPVKVFFIRTALQYG